MGVVPKSDVVTPDIGGRASGLEGGGERRPEVKVDPRDTEIGGGVFPDGRALKEDDRGVEATGVVGVDDFDDNRTDRRLGTRNPLLGSGASFLLPEYISKCFY